MNNRDFTIQNQRSAFNTLLIAFIIAVLCIAFTVIKDPALAEVRQVDGLNIYLYSEPVDQYEVIGSVKAPGLTKTDRVDYLVELIVKRAKKSYPNATGLIFIAGKDSHKAKVIKVP